MTKATENSKQVGFRACDLKNEGKTYAQITKILKKEGYKSVRGKPYSNAGVLYLIRKWNDDFQELLDAAMDGAFDEEPKRVARAYEDNKVKKLRFLADVMNSKYFTEDQKASVIYAVILQNS